MSVRERKGLAVFSYVVFLGAVMLASFATTALVSSCKTNVKPDQFLAAVVSCDTPAATVVQSVGEIVVCLAISEPASCLAGVANAISATRDEITCVVDDLAKQTTVANDSAPTPIPTTTAKLAGSFLAAQRIRVVRRE